MAPEELAIGTASRPYRGETVNGDAWQVDWHEGACRIAVIDGLGHGPQAAAAAEAALRTLGLRPELSPSDALKSCHAALVATRGAAISIATINTASEVLVYAGIGNVDAHLVRAGRQHHLVADRGIVGATLPTIRPLSFSLQAEWLLLMHTDGVRSRFQVDNVPIASTNPQQLAEGILAGWGRATDDATIVVVRKVTPGTHQVQHHT